MPDRMHELIAADERAAEKEYREKAEQKRRTLNDIAIAVPKSALWTGTALPEAMTSGVRPTLVGRVALDGPDSVANDLADFYVGETLIHGLDGREVFSWAAPIAATFYGNRTSHELCEHVIALRSFYHESDALADFEDEAVGSGILVPDCFPRPELIILPPPSIGATPHGTVAPEVPELPILAPEDRAVVDLSASVGNGAGLNGEHRESGRIRHEKVLRNALIAPKGKALAPLLSTLQPEQYELVVRGVSECTVIEGAPGTGKSVIAAHRAAFLVHEESKGQGIGVPAGKSVVLVGPTDSYVRHIQPTLARLVPGSDSVFVRSLHRLMQDCLGLSETYPSSGDLAETELDGSTRLGDTIEAFAEWCEVPTEPLEDKTMKGLYSLFLKHQQWAKDLSDEMIDYLDALPRKYPDAAQTRKLLPMLAYLRWQTAVAFRSAPPLESIGSVGHMIVDEAQDLLPLEWMLLQKINRGGLWTLVGDMQQRRTRNSPSSWSDLLALLGTQAASRFSTNQLRVGYRSTQQILGFAAQLYPPKAAPEVFSIQQGDPPRCIKVAQDMVPDEAIKQATLLADSYPAGSVAIIATDPSPVRTNLKRAGWKSDGATPAVWSRDHFKVTVARTGDLRGIEFDAVVVLEPEAFLEFSGRISVLYTALTRANRELVVVFSRPSNENPVLKGMLKARSA